MPLITRWEIRQTYVAVVFISAPSWQKKKQQQDDIVCQRSTGDENYVPAAFTLGLTVWSCPFSVEFLHLLVVAMMCSIEKNILSTCRNIANLDLVF